MEMHVSYDTEEDILRLGSQKGVRESIEVGEDIIIDIDKHGGVVGIELMDAYAFLSAMNTDISKALLSNINRMEVSERRYKNYVLLTLRCECEGKVFQQQLPLFSAKHYESPLLASA
jgi:uncharacterized protein YuzE